MSRRSQSKARLRFAASRNLRGSQRRRGVILIVVVGLMALFALVGITFVITAEQANRGAQSAAEVERYEDPPETLLQRAFLQVLVGSKNRFSSIGPNSLLEDMYGPGLIAPIPANGFVSGPVAGSANFSMGNAGAGGMMYIRNLVCKANGGAFSNSNAAYNGQVITMLTGAAAGKSSRITGYAVDASSGTATTATLRLLPFPGMTYAGPGWSDVGAPKIGDLFVINSRPFNGTGAGYVPGAGSGGTLTTGLLNEPLRMISRNATSNAALSGNPIDIGGSNPMLAALAINARDPEVRRYLETASAQGYLQLDEDYDAPDFQNPHLALYVNSTGGNFVAAPSYHRPEVLYYYANLLAGAYMGLPADPGAETIMNADALLQADLTPVVRRVFRKLTPRPLKQDHPGMADVNPAFTLDWDGTSAANARWDVDNDGDGVPDS
ncbi:MAG TPA: hypothetical protein VGE52_18995, partial [Pirellulales bacterium]